MYLGIEIGGTKLQLALGLGDGQLVATWRGLVEPQRGAAGICQQFHDALPSLLAQAGLSQARLRAIGVGFGGPVDDSTRRTVKSHQVQGWDDFPLAEWCTTNLGAPTVVGNDADVAGLGEAVHGAGKGLSPIFYVTIGSGIGGGFIEQGRILRGTGRGAAEIGHLRLPNPRVGPLAELTPAEAILEHFASGWALQQHARRLVAAGLWRDPDIVRAVDAGSVTGQKIGEAAGRGDAVALQVLAFAQAALARALCHVIALLCPRRIILGGGVALLGEELWFAPLRRLLAQQVFEPFADCYDVVPAALGEQVVLHGALALAKQAVCE